MNVRTRWVGIMLCAAVALSLTACGSNNLNRINQGDVAGISAASMNSNIAPIDSNTAEAIDDGPFKKYDQPITISLGRQGITGNNLPDGDTLESNQYLKYVEDRLNVKVKYDFSVEDLDAYNQKVNLTIASGDIPDMMVVDEQQFKRLTKAGLLADLTKVYEKYSSPLIKQYYASYSGDRVLNTGRVDGKLYALPNTNIDGSYQLLWMRKDWLDKLGLKLPTTLEDVMTIARAFKDRDPDGNGEPDTVGLLGDQSLVYDGLFFTFDPVFNMYHSYPKNWFKDASGNIVYGSTTPETKQALVQLSQMYKEGLIDQQFLTRKWEDNVGLVSSGKAGILFAPWFAGWMISDSVKADPNAEWLPLAAPLDSDGKRNVVPSAPAGTFLVVSKKAAHPEAALKLLSVEYEGIRLIDPAATELYKGKGVGWANYPLNLQLDFQDAIARDIPVYEKVIKDGDTMNLPERLIPRVNSVLKNYRDPKKDITAFADSLAFFTAGAVIGSDKITKVEPIFYGKTETMAKRGVYLDKLENETFLRIITGAAPIDDFDKFVSTWKKIGGDTIAKEIDAIVKTRRFKQPS
ncbi:extracellular solute-binding protein [Paenibacillus sp. OV219]|uniref:extracellular solute-binding protein n=1 Tax=Paenibacillus sp. OV219 TaxID=1884377 RepID=UPI0008C40B01|nr:extracellular solute-binding protein [Paenibacillus sp. OV219]SEO74040.1 putative aldouronate transport system substrate-binding protein [Paenibacillus sp. OV219]